MCIWCVLVFFFLGRTKGFLWRILTTAVCPNICTIQGVVPNVVKFLPHGMPNSGTGNGGMGFGTSCCLKWAAFLKKGDFLSYNFQFKIYSLNDDATLIVYFFGLWDLFFSAGFLSKWPAFFDLFSSLFGTCNLFEKVMVTKGKWWYKLLQWVGETPSKPTIFCWKNWGFTITIIHFELLLEMYPPTRGPASCLSTCQWKTEWETTAGYLVES